MNPPPILNILMVILTFCQAQDYYGMTYPERSMIIDALDPVHGRTTIKQVRLGELYNARLWRWGPKLEVEPDLVISIPSPAGVGMEIDAVYAELRPNLRWPNGLPITVSDIIFSLDVYRSCDKPKLKKMAEQINCESVDQSNTRFKLKPSSDQYAKHFFKNAMLYIPNFQILPKHEFGYPQLDRNSSYSVHPKGAGPFEIEKIDVEGAAITITLIRNEYHHFEKPVKMIKEVTMVTQPLALKISEGLKYADDDSYRDGIKYGIDLTVDPISSKDANTVLGFVPHLESETYVNNSWIGIGINVKKGILRSPEFRILLDKMIDNSQIIKKNYEPGDARVITGPFIQDFGIYDESLKDRKGKENDIINDLANKLKCEKKSDGFLYCLDTETGEKQKVELKLIYKDNFAMPKSIEVGALNDIKNIFKSYGITVNDQQLDPLIYSEKLAKGKDWDLYYTQHEFDFGNNPTPLFIEGNKHNHTGYHNQVLDGFINTYLASKGKKKLNAGLNIHKHCYDNVPYLFLWHVNPKSWKRKIIKNMGITPTYFFTTIHEWEVEKRE